MNCGTRVAHLCLSERINLCLSLLLFTALFKKDRSTLEHQYALLVASVSPCYNNPNNNNNNNNTYYYTINYYYQYIFCSKQWNKIWDMQNYWIAIKHMEKNRTKVWRMNYHEQFNGSLCRRSSTLGKPEWLSTSEKLTDKFAKWILKKLQD